MRTVLDLKDVVLRRANVQHGFQLREIADSLGDFWGKLNHLGARNIKKIPAEKCADIDATVQLTDREWNTLIAEFERLYEPVRFRRPRP